MQMKPRNVSSVLIILTIRELTLLHRVPYLSSTRGNDIHWHKGPPIPLHTRIYHLQKLNHHNNGIRRGLVVRGLGHENDLVLLWINSPQLRGCRLGGYSACLGKPWSFKQRSFGKNINAECRLHVDVDQLLLYFGLPPGHAEANQAYQFQRLRQ